MLFYQLLLYIPYFITILFVLFIISLNSKRIRGRYRFDALPLYMAIYLLNVLIILGPMKAAGVPFLIFTTIIMLYVIVRTAKVQLMGVTGGTGCGASTVAHILSHDIKLSHIDLNAVIGKVIHSRKDVYDKLVKEFGNEIIDPEKKGINQKYLKETILPRDALRKRLVKMLEFPVLVQLLKDLYNLTKNSRSPIIMDAPLLFDFTFLPYVSYPNLAVIVTDQTLPVKRVAERDDVSLAEATKQICTTSVQFGNIMKKSDIKILNNEDVTHLKHQLVKEIAPYLMA